MASSDQVRGWLCAAAARRRCCRCRLNLARLPPPPRGLQRDALSTFSNKGSCVDIVAPGSSILSAGGWGAAGAAPRRRRLAQHASAPLASALLLAHCGAPAHPCRHRQRQRGCGDVWHQHGVAPHCGRCCARPAGIPEGHRGDVARILTSAAKNQVFEISTAPYLLQVGLGVCVCWGGGKEGWGTQGLTLRPLWSAGGRRSPSNRSPAGHPSSRAGPAVAPGTQLEARRRNHPLPLPLPLALASACDDLPRPRRHFFCGGAEADARLVLTNHSASAPCSPANNRTLTCAACRRSKPSAAAPKGAPSCALIWICVLVISLLFC